MGSPGSARRARNPPPLAARMPIRRRLVRDRSGRRAHIDHRPSHPVRQGAEVRQAIRRDEEETGRG